MTYFFSILFCFLIFCPYNCLINSIEILIFYPKAIFSFNWSNNLLTFNVIIEMFICTFLFQFLFFITLFLLSSVF